MNRNSPKKTQRQFSRFFWGKRSTSHFLRTKNLISRTPRRRTRASAATLFSNEGRLASRSGSFRRQLKRFQNSTCRRRLNSLLILSRGSFLSSGRLGTARQQ